MKQKKLQGEEPTKQQDKKDRDKRLIFKNCPPFTDCITEINNTHLDNAKELKVAMLI